MAGIIPLMRVGTIDRITKIEDIVAYVIQFTLLNPGFVSSQFEHEMISFRVLEAKYGLDKQALATAYGQSLKVCLGNYIENEQLNVNVTAYDIDSLKYGLKIEVTDANANAILSMADVTVVDNALNIKFKS